MDIELLEIRDFIEGLPTFRGANAEAMYSLAGTISIAYQRRGSVFPPQSDTPMLYILRQGAVELRNDKGALWRKLAEGECYCNACEDEAPLERVSGHCSEDTLLYQIPCEAMHALYREQPELRRNLQRDRSERLREATLEYAAEGLGQGSLMQLAAGHLIDRAATTIDIGASAQQAAERMGEAEVSAIVITEGERLLGILTDKDLRKRLVAQGLPAETPVRELMTAEPQTLESDTPAFEAKLLMARSNIHHLPVMREGQLIGLLTHGDLIRYESGNPVYLIEEMRRSHQLEQLAELSRQLPEVQLHLVASNINSYHLGWTLAAIADTVTRQIITLTERELGPPPVAYCWVASGSLARRELGVGSDQDNALLLDNNYDEKQHGDYFRRFSEQVTDGLARCGFPLCPGDMMARTPRWRRSISQWQELFREWIENPDPKAMMLASNFFDLRAIAGERELFEQLQQDILGRASKNRIFIAHLASNALQHRPPLGFFRNFLLEHGGEHAHAFDLKLRGTIPIVDIARLQALAAGLPQVNTLDRLKACAQASAISPQGAEDLSQAYEFINTLRLRHQSECIQAGEEPDNHLDPATLSALDRDHLKECFALIAEFQKTLQMRYSIGGMR